jgi:hypothetical protein
MRLQIFRIEIVEGFAFQEEVVPWNLRLTADDLEWLRWKQNTSLDILSL